MILAVVAAALVAQTLSDPPLIEDKDRAPLEHVEDATPTEVDSGPAPGLPDAPRDPTLSPRQSDVSLAKGGTHLIGIGGVIGTGAAIVAIAGALINPTIREFAPSGAAAAGLFALFLGGGLALAITSNMLLRDLRLRKQPSCRVMSYSKWAFYHTSGLALSI